MKLKDAIKVEVCRTEYKLEVDFVPNKISHKRYNNLIMKVEKNIDSIKSIYVYINYYKITQQSQKDYELQIIK